MSTISSTDLEIFKKLSNSEAVDIVIDKNATSISEAIHKAMETKLPDDTDKDKATPSPTPPSCSVKETDDPPRSRHPSPKSPVSVTVEKRGILIELLNLEKRGFKLTKVYTMDDDLQEMTFELEKQNSCINSANTVAFLRDGLKMTLTGVEMGNKKFGPFLSLDGWSDSICSDMSRYDSCLDKIVKTYWRKSNMNPVIELAFIIVGSMVSHHFKNKFFGSPDTKPSKPTTSQSSTVRGGEAPVNVGQTTGVIKRATLKKPNSTFGIF
jgi:hypothetical protein